MRTVTAHLARTLSIAALAASSGLAASSAAASPALRQGSFANDDEHAVFSFTLASAGPVSARTLSYGGGQAPGGSLVAAGGFAPILSLFEAGSGLLQLAAGSGRTCNSPVSAAVDPATGLCWDARFDLDLAAGDYTLVLTQDGNAPLGPDAAGPFLMDGQPDYSGRFFLGQAGLRFINADGSSRTGQWALLLDVEPAPLNPVPAPA